MLLTGIALYAVVLFNDEDPVVYSDIRERFKYGSSGGGRAPRFPYWVLQAMPQVCSRHLTGAGYQSLGLIFEPGRDLPVGMSKRSVMELDRTFLSCSVCHVSTVRTGPEADPELVLGMPVNTFNLFAFQRFFFDCVRDPQFSKEVIVPEIDRLMRE